VGACDPIPYGDTGRETCPGSAVNVTLVDTGVTTQTPSEFNNPRLQRHAQDRVAISPSEPSLISPPPLHRSLCHT